MRHPARIACAERRLVKKPCFAGAATTTHRPVACEHSWTNYCGTQPIALCSHEVSERLFIFRYWHLTHLTEHSHCHDLHRADRRSTARSPLRGSPCSFAY